MNLPPADGPLGDGDHAVTAERLRATLTAPSLDAAVRARHLQAIREHAAAMPGPAPAPAPAAGKRGRRLASTVTAAGLVVVLGATGAVAASHDALPGQRLYPVKESVEQIVLASPLPTARLVDRNLTYAERRLSEAATLAGHEADPDLIAGAIAAHARLLRAAGSLADDVELAGRVDDAAAVAHHRLARLLEEGLPDEAATRARAALSAAEARLDRRPTEPPPARPAPAPVPPRQPAAPGDRREPPAPATPPGAPAETPPARTEQRPQGPPAQPAPPARPSAPSAEQAPPGAPGGGGPADTQGARQGGRATAPGEPSPAGPAQPDRAP